MPELPDVETFKRYFSATSLHQRIESSHVETDLLHEVSKHRLQMNLANHEFESTDRHGKYLFAQLDSGRWLLLHFGMTGFLDYSGDPDDRPDHTRLLIEFSNGRHLAYSCQRKLGKIGLVGDKDDWIRQSGLGPDAYGGDFDVDTFVDVLSTGRGSVKATLMNQDMIAGIGNIYSDEVLFMAGIHPRAAVSDIDRKHLGTLFRALKRVLQTAIDAHVELKSFPRTYLIRHRKEGATCPKCSGTIRRIKVSGRSSYFCDRHQK